MSDNIVQVNYIHAVKRRWGFVIVIMLTVVLLSLVFTLIQPFKYESTVKIIINQKNILGLDPYTASKASERYARNISQLLYVSEFIAQVINSNSQIDRSFFPVNEDNRRAEWMKMVNAKVLPESSILQISVYHANRAQAEILAQAIATMFVKMVPEYFENETINLKIVDKPLTSEYPVKPNILINLIFGLVAGFFLGIAILLVTYSEIKEASHYVQHFQQTKFLQSTSPETQFVYNKITSETPISELPAKPVGELKKPKVRFEPPEDLTPAGHFASVESRSSEFIAASPPKSQTEPKLPDFTDEGKIQTFYDQIKK